MQKHITLELVDNITGDSREFDFLVDSDRYHKFQNSMAGKDKVAPMHNFVVVCYTGERRDITDYLRDNEGMAAIIAGELVEEFLPKVSVTVKKPKAGQTTPAETV
jgi:hypothetical protein